MKVSDVMTKTVIKVTPEDTAAVAARLMQRHNIGALPVCSPDGRLRGMLTDRDITLRLMGADTPGPSTRVKEIMTRAVKAADADSELSAAAQIMKTEKVRRLPVCRGGYVVGMLSLSDIAKSEANAAEAAAAFFEISSNITRPKR